MKTPTLWKLISVLPALMVMTASAQDIELGEISARKQLSARNYIHSHKKVSSISSTSDDGGAIYNENTMNVDRTNFTGNTASTGGAIYNSGTMTISDRTAFVDNTATGNGGAIYNSGTLTIGNNVYFTRGGAVDGGAIYNDGGTIEFGRRTQFTYVENAIYNTAGGKITFGDGLIMSGNTAQGDKTSIYNAAGATIVFDGTARFGYNKSADQAAIINNLGDITFNDATNFYNNTSKGETQGGAIHNAAGATITFNADAMFSENRSGKEANDILNHGIININAGTASIGSGISGDGTLNIAADAVMDIGTIGVSQKNINLDGTINATLIDQRAYGRLYADNYNFGTDSVLNLTVGSVGTYKMFAGGDAAAINIDAGALYIVTNNVDGTVVVETRPVTEIMAETNLSESAAGTLSLLAQGGDRKNSMMSLRAQTALRHGEMKYLETETGKARPTDAPIAHSVATINHNQIIQVAAARMAHGNAIGRAGGDTRPDYGFWVHGLYNKTKMSDDKFHASTNGYAFGLDILLGRKFTVGVGAATNSTELHQSDRETDIDSGSIFLYGQYKPNRWYINATGNYTASRYTEHITIFDIPFVPEYDANAFGAAISTGYDFDIGLTPEIGARYLYVSQDSYNNGIAEIDGTDTQIITGVAGLKFVRLFRTGGVWNLRPMVRAAATYDFVSDNTDATITIPGAASYVVNGTTLEKFGGEFGLGLGAVYQNLEISLNYDLNLRQDYQSHTGLLKFRLTF